MCGNHCDCVISANISVGSWGGGCISFSMIESILSMFRSDKGGHPQGNLHHQHCQGIDKFTSFGESPSVGGGLTPRARYGQFW